jgi:hypothetical protein
MGPFPAGSGVDGLVEADWPDIEDMAVRFIVGGISMACVLASR